MAEHSVKAIFKNGSTKTYTTSMYQHDKGQMLEFVGADLPPEFEVHFSNDKDFGTASIVIGENNIVAIPNAYLATGSYVYAWAHDRHDVTYTKRDYNVNEEVLIEERSDPVTYTKGTTLYEVVIPVIKRPIEIKMPMPGVGESAREYSIDEENQSLVIF